jgi:hypothetical protein
MSTAIKKYEISIIVDNKIIIINIQRPGLNYIDNYFENLAGDNKEYFINYIKEIRS